MTLALIFLLVPALYTQNLLAQNLLAPKWVAQDSGVTASLRGVHAVSSEIVWASGADGTWLRTLNGVARWDSGTVNGGEKLDFRGLYAFSATDAVVMSSGEGSASKVFATTDGGAHWTLLFENPEAKGFFDGIAFRDRLNGALLGDPVSGHFTVFVTADGGKTWIRREGPVANEGEASFAASNSTLWVGGKGEIRIASGGKGGARIFRSADNGKSWKAIQTPVRHDVETAGIFSLGWRDSRHGIVVGGNYRKDQEAAANIAMTSDGGKTWVTVKSGPAGFRSAVAYLANYRLWLATGTSGSDTALDSKVWVKFDDGEYNAVSGVWGVGPKGRIAKFLAAPRR